MVDGAAAPEKAGNALIAGDVGRNRSGADPFGDRF
jgi:hypothetical protein